MPLHVYNFPFIVANVQIPRLLTETKTYTSWFDHVRHKPDLKYHTTRVGTSIIRVFSDILVAFLF